MRPSFWLAVPTMTCAVLGAQTLSKSTIRQETVAVAAVLDDWHLAAAQSEEERYFSHLAPEALFLGLDEEERWYKNAFRKWAHPGFQAHQMWEFKSSQRNIALSPSGEVAWFDELLETSSMGTARGAGVLVKDGKTWLIVQYTLSLPIPRAAFAEVKQVIAAQKLITVTPAPKEPQSRK